VTNRQALERKAPMVNGHTCLTANVPPGSMPTFTDLNAFPGRKTACDRRRVGDAPTMMSPDGWGYSKVCKVTLKRTPGAIIERFFSPRQNVGTRPVCVAFWCQVFLRYARQVELSQWLIPLSLINCLAWSVHCLG